MIEVSLRGKRPALLTKATKLYPAWPEVLSQVRACVEMNSKEVWEEQAAVMAYVASQYDHEEASILEIGANRGFTAAVMHFAAPQALVTTLEPDPERRKIARANVVHLGVVVRPEQSTAYLEETEGSDHEYDLIFVDGDHKHIRWDLPWFNRLKVGGLFLHHDYSPLESARPCPPVYEALTEFGEYLGRGPEVLIVDNTGVGMCGFYRRDGETWPNEFNTVLDRANTDVPEGALCARS